MDAPPNACGLCGDADGTLFLRARCHITAPLLARKEDEWLILSCYLPACGREVARLKLAAPEAVVPPPEART